VDDLHALRGQHHPLQPRPADLVDRDRRDAEGDAAVERRLPRRVLAEARLYDAAHDTFVNLFRGDARAPHRLADYERAELRRRETLERAQKLPRRRATRADDDGLSSLRHDCTSKDVNRES